MILSYDLNELIPRDFLVVVYFGAFAGAAAAAAFVTLKGVIRGVNWIPRIATANGVDTKIQSALEKQAENYGKRESAWQDKIKEANEKIAILEPLTKKVEQLEGTVTKLNDEVNRLTKDNLELHRTKDTLEKENGALRADKREAAEKARLEQALREQAEGFYQSNKLITSQLLQVTNVLAQLLYVIPQDKIPVEATPAKPTENKKDSSDAKPKTKTD